MAKQAGRLVKFYTGTSPGGTPLAGGRDHGLKINGEPIDVTDKDADGFRTLFSLPGVRSVDVEVTGFLDGTTILERSLGAETDLLFAGYVEIEDIGTISGNWFLSGLSLSSPHDNAVEQEFTLMSSGAFTWAAA